MRDTFSADSSCESSARVRVRVSRPRLFIRRYLSVIGSSDIRDIGRPTQTDTTMGFAEMRYLHCSRFIRLPEIVRQHQNSRCLRARVY